MKEYISLGVKQPLPKSITRYWKIEKGTQQLTMMMKRTSGSLYYNSI
jgi:hypothetical protein